MFQRQMAPQATKKAAQHIAGSLGPLQRCAYFIGHQHLDQFLYQKSVSQMVIAQLFDHRSGVNHQGPRGGNARKNINFFCIMCPRHDLGQLFCGLRTNPAINPPRQRIRDNLKHVAEFKLLVPRSIQNFHQSVLLHQPPAPSVLRTSDRPLYLQENHVPHSDALICINVSPSPRG